MIEDMVASDNYSSQIQDFYPVQYYLTLKSTNYSKWKERWECMLWDQPKENYEHLQFEEFPLSDINDRGQFFKLNVDDLHSPLKASKKEIEDAHIWVIPGALSTSKYGMSCTMRDLKTFFSESNYYYQNNALVFCPYSTGKERYKEAVEYNSHQKEYYSVRIEKFVRKYFIPRLIKEKKLAFITYSIGAKELVMIENAARDILLNEYSYPIIFVQKLFQKISAICIGDAIDINNLSELRFKRITLLSASDQGLFIPKSLYYKIYNRITCNRPFTAFKLDQYETLIFLGHQASVEILDGKLNQDGHSLAHYLRAMSENLPNTLLKYLYSLVFTNNRFGRLLTDELDQLDYLLTEI